MRTARVERATAESKVSVELDLDGSGKVEVSTGIGFYDHMLSQLGKHGGFDLRGTRSNRSAIGAEVRVHWDGQEQLQQVFGGSGYSAQNQRPLHFGLGEATEIDRAVIRWPSGEVQTIEAPAVGRVHKVEEPS